MADSREGNVILAPGFTQKDTVKPTEIFYSMVGRLVKGCTLDVGQGTLQAGTPLEYAAGEKNYIAATADANAVGFLMHDVETGVTGDTPKLANIVLGGEIKTSAIPLAYATPDLTVAGIATALGGTVNTQFGFLKF